MKNKVIGVTLIFTGIMIIIISLFYSKKTRVSFAQNVKGIGAGISFIMLGIYFFYH